MDKQNEEDDVFESDGIKVVAEKDISFLFEDSVIDSKKGLFGEFYTVSRNGEDPNSGCS